MAGFGTHFQSWHTGSFEQLTQYKRGRIATLIDTYFHLKRDPGCATASKSWKPWMRSVSTWREEDRRIYRPWRWQTLRDRRTKGKGALIRSVSLTTMVRSISAVSTEVLAPQSSIFMSVMAHCPMLRGLRTLTSLFSILMTMTCLNLSTLNWGRRLSLSVSWIKCFCAFSG